MGGVFLGSKTKFVSSAHFALFPFSTHLDVGASPPNTSEEVRTLTHWNPRFSGVCKEKWTGSHPREEKLWVQQPLGGWAGGAASQGQGHLLVLSALTLPPSSGLSLAFLSKDYSLRTSLCLAPTEARWTWNKAPAPCGLCKALGWLGFCPRTGILYWAGPSFCFLST